MVFISWSCKVFKVRVASWFLRVGDNRWLTCVYTGCHSFRMTLRMTRHDRPLSWQTCCLYLNLFDDSMTTLSQYAMAPAPQKGLSGFLFNADQSDQTVSKYIVHLNKSTESIIFFCKDSVDVRLLCFSSSLFYRSRLRFGPRHYCDSTNVLQAKLFLVEIC